MCAPCPVESAALSDGLGLAGWVNYVMIHKAQAKLGLLESRCPPESAWR